MIYKQQYERGKDIKKDEYNMIALMTENMPPNARRIKKLLEPAKITILVDMLDIAEY